MKSRMDKYNNNLTTTNRTDRHKDLYKEAESINLAIPRTYSNSKVIDEVNKEIDIDKIKKYIEKMNSTEKEKRTRINDIELPDTNEEVVEEEKDYDLNSVLERARKQREVDYEQERSRKVNYSYEDILAKIQKYNNQKVEEEIKESDLNTNEKTLVNLINTIQMNKQETDLFEDLKGNENTQLLGTIDEMASDESFKDEVKKEITRSTGFSMSFKDGFGNTTLTRTETVELEQTMPTEELEKSKELSTTNSFYTDSDMFDKRDFNVEIGEDDEDDEDDKVSPLLIVGIVIAVIILVTVLVVLANYVFELGLF